MFIRLSKIFRLEIIGQQCKHLFKKRTKDEGSFLLIYFAPKSWKLGSKMCLCMCQGVQGTGDIEIFAHFIYIKSKIFLFLEYILLFQEYS